MTHNQKIGADWLQREGTFGAKCSRDVTKCVTINQKGGVSIGDEEGILIHEEIQRLVERNGVKMICEYLLQMARDKKILLPLNPSTVYAELVRMGMPKGEGFSEKYFTKNYRRN